MKRDLAVRASREVNRRTAQELFSPSPIKLLQIRGCAQIAASGESAEEAKPTEEGTGASALKLARYSTAAEDRLSEAVQSLVKNFQLHTRRSSDEGERARPPFAFLPSSLVSAPILARASIVHTSYPATFDRAFCDCLDVSQAA